MPRQKSAVLKGKTSAAVKKADKVKQLLADIRANEREAVKLLKEVSKLSEKHAKLTAKLDKAQAPKEEAVTIETPVVLDPVDVQEAQPETVQLAA